MSDIKPGDKVEWRTPQGKTTGHATQKITDDNKISGHQVRADKSDPQIKVKSDKTGKEAIHKPGALDKA